MYSGGLKSPFLSELLRQPSRRMLKISRHKASPGSRASAPAESTNVCNSVAAYRAGKPASAGLTLMRHAFGKCFPSASEHPAKRASKSPIRSTQKYVKFWPFGLVLVALGCCFTYFWGPGRCSKLLMCSLVQYSII